MKHKVLIVEDSPEVRSGLQIALEGQGYRVKSAPDGREGILLFREWKPDIALLDIRMPRLSGIDVCTLIRNESDVPVIMFSAVDETDDIKLAISRGATDYVLKDTGFRELLNRVEKHLRQRYADVVLSQSVARGRVLPFSKAGAKARSAPDRSGRDAEVARVDALGPVEPVEVLEDLAIVAHSDPESLSQLVAVTGRTGFDVVACSTGQEAIELLAMRRPKLVVVGNTLTDMNCLAVVQATVDHNLGELIGIVLAVGRRAPELARRARYIGVHETVVKPWNDGRLDLAIRSALAATRDARIRIRAA